MADARWVIRANTPRGISATNDRESTTSATGTITMRGPL
jgi:hypothetical protein